MQYGKKKNIIIIGGGLGGLALAIRLAVNGWRVTIVEKNDRLGGKMNILQKNGYRFDTGPSLITLPDIFRELFQIAGTTLEDHLELIKIDPMAYYVFDDGTAFEYTSSLPKWLETIRNLDKEDINGFFRFMELGTKLFELSRKTFFKKSPFEFPLKLNLKDIKNFPLQYGWGNYAKTVDKFFRNPKLKQMFNRYPTYVGSSPYLCPATLIVIPYIEYVYGGWYIKGGLYKLIDTLTEIAKYNKVQTYTNAEVVEILNENKKVKGVRLNDNSILDADIVVMNGDVSSVGKLLNDENHNYMSEENRSLSGLVFLIGINKKLNNAHHHTIYFSKDYELEFKQLFTEKKFPDDPTTYLNIASSSDNNAVSGNGETLYIMSNAPAVDKINWTQKDLDRSWQLIKTRLVKNGFPEISSNIIVKENFTPTDLEKKFNNPGGAIYGKHSHGWKNTFLRPPNKDRKYNGLYYVGGSTHPGGGTPMVLLSAAITSSLIEKYESA